MQENDVRVVIKYVVVQSDGTGGTTVYLVDVSAMASKQSHGDYLFATVVITKSMVLIVDSGRRRRFLCSYGSKKTQ